MSFCEKKQETQGSFKIVVGDSMLVYYYEFFILKFVISWIFLEATSFFGAQAFALHGPRSSVSSCSITYSSPHSARNDGDLLHSLGCMLLSSRVESTSHGSKYQEHQDSFEPDFKIKLNENSMLMFCQIISVALHGPINSYVVVYVPNQLERIPPFPENNIPPDI